MARKTKKTLRKMTPLARELAKIGNDLASANTRLMNLTEKVAVAERKAEAAENFMASLEATEPEAHLG
jgi:hypothetical protein